MSDAIAMEVGVGSWWGTHLQPPRTYTCKFEEVTKRSLRSYHASSQMLFNLNSGVMAAPGS